MPTTISGQTLSQPHVPADSGYGSDTRVDETPEYNLRWLNGTIKNGITIDRKNISLNYDGERPDGGTGDATPKYPIPPGNWLMFVKFRVTCGVCIESFGITTLNVCDGYQ